MGPPKLVESRSGAAVEPLLMSMEDLQRFLGVGRTLAFRLTGCGDIETVKLGRRTLVLTESARGYVQRLREDKAH